jgi:hypothetical protein
MIAFIDDHCEAHGVEPICKVLPIAPSTYHVARRADLAKRSARTKRDTVLKPEYAGSSMTTSESVACARSGGNCGARTMTWRGVR